VIELNCVKFVFCTLCPVCDGRAEEEDGTGKQQDNKKMNGGTRRNI
jgi:hypothetical protein